MISLRRVVALVGICAALNGCSLAAFTAAGVVIDVAMNGYKLLATGSTGISQGIEIACRQLAAKEAVLVAAGKGDVVASTEAWSGATVFCNPANPPPADPIAGVFWLATVVAEMK